MSEHNHMIDKDVEILTNKVEGAIFKIGEDKREQILRDFHEFKSHLGKRINMGMSIGLSEEQMATIAEKVAGYLATHEEPRNSEEKLLQELWKSGTREEQHMLAHMLVRMTQSANRIS